MAHYEFQEELFGYELADREKWRSKDMVYRRQLAAISGPMGSDKAPINQVQNFAEVSYAGYLASGCGYPKGGIIYENYYLSGRAFDQKQLTETAQDGKRLSGTNVLRQLLSDHFFREFDRLYELNHQTINKQLDRIHVDIAAVDPVGKRIGFFEIKTYRKSVSGTEDFEIHQQMCLGFIREIAAILGDRAFCAAPCTIETKLIAFVPNGKLNAVKAQTYSVDFLS